MEHRRLGASGFFVPALSFGAATFGGRGEFFGQRRRRRARGLNILWLPNGGWTPAAGKFGGDKAGRDVVCGRMNASRPETGLECARAPPPSRACWDLPRRAHVSDALEAFRPSPGDPDPRTGLVALADRYS